MRVGNNGLPRDVLKLFGLAVALKRGPDGRLVFDEDAAVEILERISGRLQESENPFALRAERDLHFGDEKRVDRALRALVGPMGLPESITAPLAVVREVIAELIRAAMHGDAIDLATVGAYRQVAEAAFEQIDSVARAGSDDPFWNGGRDGGLINRCPVCRADLGEQDRRHWRIYCSTACKETAKKRRRKARTYSA